MPKWLLTGYEPLTLWKSGFSQKAKRRHLKKLKQRFTRLSKTRETTLGVNFLPTFSRLAHRTQQAQETLEKIIGSARRSSSVVTEIANALHDVMETSRSVVVAMEEVSAMTKDFTIAANEQEMSTDQINQAIMSINTLTSEIHQETTQQLAGVHTMLDDMKDITRLANQSLGSSQQINATTEELSLQADLLLQLVERFKLSS